MTKNDDTVRFTAKEIEAMRSKGEDRTDYARLDSMSAAEIAASAAEDDFDWSKAEVGFPAPKRQLTMRLDGDVIDWFRAQGKGYQTRMNTVLRRFIEAQRNPQR